MILTVLSDFFSMLIIFLLLLMTFWSLEKTNVLSVPSLNAKNYEPVFSKSTEANASYCLTFYLFY